MSEGWQEVAYRLSQLTWQRLAHSQQQAAKRTQISPLSPPHTLLSLSASPGFHTSVPSLFPFEEDQSSAKRLRRFAWEISSRELGSLVT